MAGDPRPPLPPSAGRRILLGAALAFLALRAVLGVLEALDRLPRVEDPSAQWLQAALVPALVVLALAAAVQALRHRRGAAGLALWGALVEFVTLGRTEFHQATGSLLLVLAWLAASALLAAALRPGGPAPARPPSLRRDLSLGASVTLAGLLLLEGAAGIAIQNRFRVLQVVPLPGLEPPREFAPGLPVVATLGSSPANAEVATNRPFSAVLADRLEGRANLMYYRAGGLDSEALVRVARILADGPHPPDAFVLYTGHQDMNRSEGAAFLRNLDPVGASPALASAARFAIRQSALVRLPLYLLWRARYDRLAAAGDDAVDRVTERWAANMERILDLARDRGMRVFAVTVQMDRAAVSPASLRHMGQTNDWMRSLPGRHPFVTLVDFEPVLDAAYPDGRLPGCEPFEAARDGQGCGDPYHLDARGHALLADTLQPAVEEWLRTRGTPPQGTR